MLVEFCDGSGKYLGCNTKKYSHFSTTFQLTFALVVLVCYLIHIYTPVFSITIPTSQYTYIDITLIFYQFMCLNNHYLLC